MPEVKEENDEIERIVNAEFEISRRESSDAMLGHLANDPSGQSKTEAVVEKLKVRVICPSRRLLLIFVTNQPPKTWWSRLWEANVSSTSLSHI